MLLTSETQRKEQVKQFNSYLIVAEGKASELIRQANEAVESSNKRIRQEYQGKIKSLQLKLKAANITIRCLRTELEFKLKQEQENIAKKQSLIDRLFKKKEEKAQIVRQKFY